MRLNKFELIENELYLVGNKEVNLRKRLEQNTLFDELPLILREKGSGTRQTMERFLNKKKFIIRKKMELTTNEAVKQAVIAGLGYSIMPLIGIRNEIDAGLIKIIPINGLPIKTMWRLIWLKEKKLSPVADAFLKYLHQEKANIIKNYFVYPSKLKH
jgi:DNA-binding transcriptional LysR family regulator